MLTYLTGSVRPDIAMAVHQCAQFSINPIRSHEQAVMRIGVIFSQQKGKEYFTDRTCLKASRFTLMLILQEVGIQAML
jgi:hypothetical protein